MTTDAIERLYQRRTFGIKLGLDVERALLRGLGNPEDRLAVIHVAGSNGKGSVCAMMEAILLKAGLSVGFYSSPHLVRFNERFRVGGRPINDDVLEDLVARIESAASHVESDTGHEPTFFECATAMAFTCFAEAGVKVAIMETGMGGRLDATNVVTPVVSVITRIGLEHMEHLGPDIETIAREKAGIVKAGRPVVCGAMDARALEVIRDAAASLDAPLIDASEAAGATVREVTTSGQKLSLETGHGSYGTTVLPLLGRHQLENACTAVTALEVFAGAAGVGLAPESVSRGLANTHWPGRCQVLECDPLVILDGAHNADAARTLAAALTDLQLEGPVALVVGMCEDKDVEAFFRPLKGACEAVWAVPLRNERGLSAEELAVAAKACADSVRTAGLKQAVEEAKLWAREQGGAVCIAGSLFLVGEVLEMIENGTWKH